MSLRLLRSKHLAGHFAVIGFLAFGLSISLSVDARMYRWNDPQTGTAYLSGSPPSWYRAGQGGPRIQVFEGGKLVDDTEWQASLERQKELRARALEEEKQRRLLAEQKRLEEARQAAQATQQVQKSEGDDTRSSLEQTTEMMRDIIRGWEQLEKAKADESLP